MGDEIRFEKDIGEGEKWEGKGKCCERRRRRGKALGAGREAKRDGKDRAGRREGRDVKGKEGVGGGRERRRASTHTHRSASATGSSD